MQPGKRNLVARLLLVLAMLALFGLSQLTGWQRDWSRNGDRLLNEQTVDLLNRLPGALVFTALLGDDQRIRDSLDALLQRYKKEKPDIEIRLLRAIEQPAMLRKYQLDRYGGLVIEYQQRSEILKQVNETRLTNALYRLFQDTEQWLVLLSESSTEKLIENSPLALQRMHKDLQRQAINVQTLNSDTFSSVPDNTTVVIQRSILPKLSQVRKTMLKDYLQRGGNLLWLLEPGQADECETLQVLLNINCLPGTLVSSRTAKLGLSDPSVLVLPIGLSQHPVTDGLQNPVILIGAVALDASSASGWQVKPILRTDQQTWTETSKLDQPPLKYEPEQGEQAGVLQVGLAMQRRLASGGQQRVLVIGDSDFLNDSFIDNGANREFTQRIVRWLTQSDTLIDLKTATRPDHVITLTNTHAWLIQYGFPYVLPALLLLIGARAFWRK